MTIRVRRITEDDFPFAVALTDTERWGFTVEDFQRFLALSPDGCFLIEYDDERAGLLTTMVYGRLGWIGNVIVSARLRGRGLGAAMLQHALDYLEDQGCLAVRLWAYENTTALYEKFGFRTDGLESRRWIGFGHTQHETPPAQRPKGAQLKLIDARAVETIVALDRAQFGADRSRVLLRIVGDHPRSGYIARNADRSAAGFVLAKVSPKGCELGPWVVDPSPASKWAVAALLEAVLGRLAGQSIELGVYEGRADVHEFLIAHGFHRGFSTLRMTRGTMPGPDENTAGICAIGALEKG